MKTNFVNIDGAESLTLSKNIDLMKKNQPALSVVKYQDGAYGKDRHGKNTFSIKTFWAVSATVDGLLFVSAGHKTKKSAEKVRDRLALRFA